MPGVMVGGGGIMVLDSYSGLGLGPLIPVKGTLNNLGYQSIPNFVPTGVHTSAQSGLEWKNWTGLHIDLGMS